jgi:hypothetical protein
LGSDGGPGGGNSAIATGYDAGFHDPSLAHSVPVAVLASGLVRCADGSANYSRIRVSDLKRTKGRTVQAQVCPNRGGISNTVLAACPTKNYPGVDHIAVNGISCSGARSIAEGARAGFKCLKTGEARGYTAWRCSSPTARLTYRIYGDD